MATAAQLAPLVLVLLLLLQPAFSASLVEPLDCPTMVCKSCIITTANCNENCQIFTKIQYHLILSSVIQDLHCHYFDGSGFEHGVSAW